MALWSSPVLRETLLLAAFTEWKLPKPHCADRISSPAQLALNGTLKKTAVCLHATMKRDPRRKVQALKEHKMWHLPSCLPESKTDACYLELLKIWEGFRKSRNGSSNIGESSS